MSQSHAVSLGWSGEALPIMHVIEAQSAWSGASRSLQYKQESAFRQGAITPGP